MSSLDAAVDKPFTLGNYLSILLELVTSKRLLVAFFPSLRFIWDIFIQVNLNHSLPEMMYSWWLQVVWSVATLLHSWIWCFNLVLAHREYPSDSYCIYYECLLILSWVSSGYVSGWWGVLFDPKVSLHRAKKDTSFEIFTFVDFTHFKRDLGSRLHDFFFENFLCASDELLSNLDAQKTKPYAVFMLFHTVSQKGMTFEKNMKLSKQHKNCIRIA